MEDLVGLEAELERRASDENVANSLWHSYQKTKEYLEDQYYPWIQASCPYFTDHGKRHIESVIQATSLLVEPILSSEDESRPPLSTLDIFLLLNGVLWHDVGNAISRVGHADMAGKISDEVRRLAFPNIDVQRLVDLISKAHAGKDGLHQTRYDDADCTASGKLFTVYPIALAAIVRFADEISEDRNRVSQALLDRGQIPEKNRIFWEYAGCITASKPEPRRQRAVITISVPYEKAVERFPSVEFPDLEGDTGQISLIEYIVRRLEKMNNERVYCSQAFARYLTIRQIEARFTLYNGLSSVPDYDDQEFIFGDSALKRTDYPATKIFEEFFTRHPEWKPETIRSIGSE